MANILLTGGNGFIGSHIAVVLAERGHQVVILDDFSNSEREVQKRLAAIIGNPVPVIEVDIRTIHQAAEAIAKHRVDAVIHLAALKAVGESEADPLRYFDVNLVGLIRLLEVMAGNHLERIVFSSSATVYGQPDFSPIPEDAPARVNNIYAETKLIGEMLIADLVRTGKLRSAAQLRYFNPVGAHPSARIGENPLGEPGNLMPYICQVASGRRATLKVFGADYDTPDGTGVRDYLHVMDLALAHALAVERVLATDGIFTANLGTGIGISVFEMIRAFEQIIKRPLPHEVVGRRPGDVASYFADPTAAHRILGWRAQLGLQEMCRDAWAWESARTGAR